MSMDQTDIIDMAKFNYIILAFFFPCSLSKLLLFSVVIVLMCTMGRSPLLLLGKP